MRIYRNIFEYFASRGVEEKFKEAGVAKLLDEVRNDKPLHTRGTSASAEYNRSYRLGAEWNKAWKDRDTKTLKAMLRRATVESKMTWLCADAASSLSLLGQDEYDQISARATKLYGQTLYDVHKENFPLYIGSGNGIYVSINDEKLNASFRRGSGVSLTVSMRSLHQDFKRVYNDQRKIVVLDYWRVLPDIAFAVWAYPSRKNKQPLRAHGAMCDGAFIPGYAERDIVEHAETIRLQARIMETNRALGVSA
jgi:hypothetical protein